MVKSEMKTVKNQNGKEQVMKKEFKEIIEKYPAFSRELISNMVNEFEDAGEMSEERFIKAGNGNIYLFEENRKYYNLVSSAEKTVKFLLNTEDVLKKGIETEILKKVLNLPQTILNGIIFLTLNLIKK